MFDNRIEKMNPGQVITDARLPDMIEQMGKAIASAQLAMDSTGVKIGTMLGESKVDFKDVNGNSVERSLLELGFTPTFYHFSETEIELKMTVSMRVEKSFGFELDANVGSNDDDPNRAVMYGASVSLDYHQKFNFDVTASSTIKTKLKAVPAPQVFLEAIRDHVSSGGTLSSSD